jgi:hypothetical protein
MEHESTFGEIRKNGSFQMSNSFLYRSKTPISLFMKSRKNCECFVYLYKHALSLSLSFPFRSFCRAIVLQSRRVQGSNVGGV